MRTISLNNELEKITLLWLLLYLCVNTTLGYFNTSYLKQANEGELKAALRQMVNDFRKIDQPSIQIQGLANNDPSYNNQPEAGVIGAQVPNDHTVGTQPVIDAVQNLTHFLNKDQININQVDGGFTLWTQWSSCPSSCGRTALRSRERYCTNPTPANGGKNCDGPRFQLRLCPLKKCVVHGGLTTWTAWSHCSKKCGQGVKIRHRYCTNPRPAYGGRPCHGKKMKAKYCYGKAGCVNSDQSIVDIDPQAVCGYDPCEVVKCFGSPYARCLSDFRCKAVFFDSEERKIDFCKGNQLYLSADPENLCRFDPCKYTACMGEAAAKCLVNTKCHPVFLDALGKKLSCKGVFKVPARYICGTDPCNGAICAHEPTARCLVDHECKPVFVNSLDTKMTECSDKMYIPYFLAAPAPFTRSIPCLFELWGEEGPGTKERDEVVNDVETNSEDQSDSLSQFEFNPLSQQKEAAKQLVHEEEEHEEIEDKSETDRENKEELGEENDSEEEEESGGDEYEKRRKLPSRFARLNLLTKHQQKKKH